MLLNSIKWERIIIFHLLYIVFVDLMFNIFNSIVVVDDYYVLLVVIVFVDLIFNIFNSIVLEVGR